MVSNIFLLLLEYRKIDLKKPCFHLSMRKSWINDKITTFPELIRELRTWGNWTIWNSWRGSLIHGERDAWVGPSMADQSRRRCQPPYLRPHRRKGMPVSRNKYYLPQPLLVPIRCLTFNKKLWNIHIRKIKSLSIDKEMTQMLEVYRENLIAL